MCCVRKEENIRKTEKLFGSLQLPLFMGFLLGVIGGLTGEIASSKENAVFVGTGMAIIGAFLGIGIGLLINPSRYSLKKLSSALRIMDIILGIGAILIGFGGTVGSIMQHAWISLFCSVLMMVGGWYFLKRRLAETKREETREKGIS